MVTLAVVSLINQLSPAIRDEKPTLLALMRGPGNNPLAKEATLSTLSGAMILFAIVRSTTGKVFATTSRSNRTEGTSNAHRNILTEERREREGKEPGHVGDETLLIFHTP
jgi:hypothetical protein